MHRPRPSRATVVTTRRSSWPAPSEPIAPRPAAATARSRPRWPRPSPATMTTAPAATAKSSRQGCPAGASRHQDGVPRRDAPARPAGRPQGHADRSSPTGASSRRSASPSVRPPCSSSPTPTRWPPSRSAPRPRSSSSRSSGSSTIPYFLGTMALQPPPAIGAFLIGFTAKRASWLGGLVYGIFVTIVAIVVLQTPAGRLLTGRWLRGCGHRRPRRLVADRRRAVRVGRRVVPPVPGPREPEPPGPAAGAQGEAEARSLIRGPVRRPGDAPRHETATNPSRPPPEEGADTSRPGVGGLVTEARAGPGSPPSGRGGSGGSGSPPLPAVAPTLPHAVTSPVTACPFPTPAAD